MKSAAAFFNFYDENNYYVVDEYQKKQILKLKYFEDQFSYVINLADNLERFLEYKKHKIKTTQYYVVKINFANYKIKFVEIEEFLK